MAKKKSKSCRPPFRISHAGHLLSTKGTSKSGKILSSEGKAEKKKRLKRGCLNGPPGTFKLTEKQKRKLPIKLQRAILSYQRKLGKRIID
jgi:hypothetical protein